MCKEWSAAKALLLHLTSKQNRNCHLEIFKVPQLRRISFDPLQILLENTPPSSILSITGIITLSQIHVAISSIAPSPCLSGWTYFEHKRTYSTTKQISWLFRIDSRQILNWRTLAFLPHHLNITAHSPTAALIIATACHYDSCRNIVLLVQAHSICVHLQTRWELSIYFRTSRILAAYSLFYFPRYIFVSSLPRYNSQPRIAQTFLIAHYARLIATQAAHLPSYCDASRLYKSGTISTHLRRNRSTPLLSFAKFPQNFNCSWLASRDERCYLDNTHRWRPVIPRLSGLPLSPVMI